MKVCSARNSRTRGCRAIFTRPRTIPATPIAAAIEPAVIASGESAPRVTSAAAADATATMPTTPAMTLTTLDAMSSTAQTPSMSFAASSYPDRPSPMCDIAVTFRFQPLTSAYADITPPITWPTPGIATPATSWRPASRAWMPIVVTSPVTNPLPKPSPAPEPT